MVDKGKDAQKDEGTGDKAFDGAVCTPDRATSGTFDEQTDSLRNQGDMRVGD